MESRQSSCPSLVLVTQRHDGDNDGVGHKRRHHQYSQYTVLTYCCMVHRAFNIKEVSPSRPRTIPFLPLATTELVKHYRRGLSA
jgi:hypothetical protein